MYEWDVAVRLLSHQGIIRHKTKHSAVIADKEKGTNKVKYQDKI